jgi:hypothetical protein
MTTPVVVLLAAFAAVSRADNGEDTFRFLLTRSEGPTPLLMAGITSTRSYPCTGYRIRTRTTRERDTLTVHITGMVRPPICLGGSADAEGEASLGNIAAGRYILRFTSGGNSDLYVLTVTRGVPTLRVISNRFTFTRQ